MKQARELYNLLRNIGNKGDDIRPAIVVSVDKTMDTCTVDFDELEMGDVRLRSVIKAGVNGVVKYPLVGSVVLLKKIADEMYYVAMYSDVEETETNIGGKVYKLNSNGHLIGGGNDTLLQAQILIIDAISKIMVLYGNNPDYLALQQAKEKLLNILQ